jgi:bifunctional non-homologous end joining protein LigD
MPKKPKAASNSRTALSDEVDRQLARYREMRDFTITAEPSGSTRTTKPRSQKAPSKTAAPGLPFVIQKHAATRLHYDFRLGWNGVLKSWAVTKGPSYVVADKRLAVQVEDHPMEYGGFEGIIPKGQYGGGTVMVWDQGTWEPQAISSDVDAALRSGSLKFILHGEKLHGKWALIRMGGKAANESKPNWLLIKEHDGFERPADEPSIIDTEPNSAVTGRDLQQIAASQDHVWNSKDTAKGKAWYRNDAVPPSDDKSGATAKRSAPTPPKYSSRLTELLQKAPKEDLPKFITPELAQPSDRPPRTAGWVHELKLDGYRVQVRKEDAKVRLLTRTGLDWTHRMRSIAQLAKDIPAQSAIIDGEVVVLREDGISSFADLQAAFQEGARMPLTYFAFDLLHLNGHNLRGLPLVDRKAILAQLMKGLDGALLFSDHLEADGDVVFRKAAELHAEGIISKRAASPYVSGRGGDWLKSKCVHEQEFVVGGFTEPSNGSHGIGALLLGYYEGSKLVYAGRTGTGFTQKTHASVRDQLDKIRQAATPFDNPPLEASKGALWVKPQLVAQVNFANWTSDNVVRHASFQGLRDDIPAREVRREEPSASVESPEENHAAAPPEPPIVEPRVPRAAKNVQAPETAPKAPRTAKPPKATKAALEHAPIRLTHPAKILDAESQLTKQQLADYYWAVAPHMLPYVAHRPLSLVRCPEGTGHPCFFQKHVTHTFPSGVESVDVRDKKTGKIEKYITLSTPEALAGMAQMGVLEIHPWGSKNDDLEHPDMIIFDLDPDEAISWRTLADSAADVRHQLGTLNLKSFLKTTGGKGLHVVIPLQAEQNWGTVKQFAYMFASAMEQMHPDLYLTKMSKAARKGRIFIDYLRNERGSTAIAPYSSRARSGMAVALPLSWSDLKLPERPVFRVANFEEWRQRLDRDPWKDIATTHQHLAMSES